MILFSILGVGDTGGLDKDKSLLRKLQTIFSPKFGHVKSLDAICFVSPAGEPRLTPQQAYVFDKIITSFGKDMKNNIFGLFTKDDGTSAKNPKGLDAFNAAGIGLASWFK